MDLAVRLKHYVKQHGPTELCTGGNVGVVQYGSHQP